MSQVNPPSASDRNLAAGAAATEIVALINSRSRTPTKDEIAAIIAKAFSAPSAAREIYLASSWHRALEEYLSAISRVRPEDDDQLDALDARLGDAAEAICDNPVRTFDDVIVRAAIAAHFYEGDFDDPDYILTGRLSFVPGAVVRSVLELAGMKFDAQGQLLYSCKTPGGRCGRTVLSRRRRGPGQQWSQGPASIWPRRRAPTLRLTESRWSGHGCSTRSDGRKRAISRHIRSHVSRCR